ncbi:MAG: 4Fe-4S dicluster domain-containing protein [bacterium]
MAATAPETFDLADRDFVRQLVMAFDVPEKHVDETKYLPEILQRILTPDEARTIVRLGSKAYTLARAADRLGLNEAETKNRLKVLKQKGVLMSFPDLVAADLKYKITSMLLLHDMTLLNTRDDPQRFGEDFLELWDNFYKEVMVATFARMSTHAKENEDTIFRVIPVNEPVEVDHVSRVLPYETVAGIIEGAQQISLQPCVCRIRTHGKNCRHMVEDACMAFDMMAEQVVKKGHGRMVSKAEALEQLKKTTADGLVHLSGNSSEGFVFICSCCECCCGVLYAVVNRGIKFMAMPSRYRAAVEAESCSGCGSCVDLCNFKAIAVGEDEVARIDGARCYGCGVCAYSCPEEAIRLNAVRSEDFIPQGNFLLKMMKGAANFR